MLGERTAIITGSGRNIGRAIALKLAAERINVVINGHKDRTAVEQVVAEVQKLGGNALGVMADVSNPDDVTRLFQSAVDYFGSVDIAISNVAIRPRQAFLDISVEDWHLVLNTNLNSAFYLARCVIPHMKEKRWGRIIHISGHDGFAGAAFRTHNVVSKAGIHGLTKALALEFGHFGITVNTIAPGVIDTIRDVNHYPNLEERYERLRAELPVRRIGFVSDIVHTCMFLVSEEASFITGEVLHVNGGAFLGTR